jgi:uncharacterized OsmC-like protein
MKSKELRALQAPLKEKYKTDPDEAEWNLHAEAAVGEDITCEVETEAGTVQAGLHPATGGDGSHACSGDMLLQALVACAGVTLKSVATAMEIDIEKGTVRANGVLDFRGTLGVDRDTPVGFKKIELTFELNTNADQEKLEKLIELTERYCVVYQTLRNSPETSSSIS